jgi:hypothetical protein
MFRLLLMVGGSSLVLGLATASYALTAPPHTLDGFAPTVIQVADPDVEAGDMEEEAVEQAVEPEEVTSPDESASESGEAAPTEESEIDQEEGKN